jgi:hypothetical protein
LISGFSAGEVELTELGDDGRSKLSVGGIAWTSFFDAAAGASASTFGALST